MQLRGRLAKRQICMVCGRAAAAVPVLPVMTAQTGVAVFVSSIVSLFVALVSLSLHCSEQSACLSKKTCATFDATTCSFQNSVSAAGWRLFNTSTTASSLASLERGVCAPGMRQNFIDGELTCLRQRNYPVATNTEIQQPSAGSAHMRACGEWINARTSVSAETDWWAFFDEEQVAREVVEALLGRWKVRGALSVPSKFRQACVRMVTSGSQGAAGTLAFNHLDALLGPLPATRTDVLHDVGLLAGHFCDAPVQVGLTYSVNSNVGLAANLTGGAVLSARKLTEAMYAVGIERAVRDQAEAFSALMMMASLDASSLHTVPFSDISELFFGSVSGTDAESALGTPPSLVVNAYTEPIQRFLAALGTTPSASVLQMAHAYLRGLAARCALATRSVVTGELGYAMPASPVATNNAPDAFRHAALGRLKHGSNNRLAVVTPELMLHATSGTWSSLSATSVLQGASRSHAVVACEAAMGTAFPDHVDKAAFDALVTPTLYARLEHAEATLKPLVADALLGSVIASALVDPNDAHARAMATITKIAGAPAGTWGGRIGSIPDPGFSSGDGALLMLLKQGRALFVNRQELIKDGANGVCNMPPLFSSITRNAYFLPTHGCSVILPGILVPPFAGAAYDDASLFSRIGYVIAHEIAHVTAAVAWNSAAMASLLTGYAPAHHQEAIADVVAVLAVRASGKTNSDILCMSVSQLWCARTLHQLYEFFAIIRGPAGTHPPPNERGDLACAFLYRHST